MFASYSLRKSGSLKALGHRKADSLIKTLALFCLLLSIHNLLMSFSRVALVVKNPPAIKSIPRVSEGRFPGEGAWQPTPLSLPWIILWTEGANLFWLNGSSYIHLNATLSCLLSCHTLHGSSNSLFRWSDDVDEVGLTLLLPVIQVGYGAFVLPALSSAGEVPNSLSQWEFLFCDMPVH